MYLEQGGILILKLVKPDYMNTNFRDRILYEEELGEIARNQSVDDTVRIGPFPQWKKLQFFLKDSVFSAHPLITYNPPSFYVMILLRLDTIIKWNFICTEKSMIHKVLSLSGLLNLMLMNH